MNDVHTLPLTPFWTSGDQITLSVGNV